MLVTIPAREQHEGFHSLTIEISAVCPVCGGARGATRPALSYDGSRRLSVDCWDNPCGHVDKYHLVRAEYRASVVAQMNQTERSQLLTKSLADFDVWLDSLNDFTRKIRGIEPADIIRRETTDEAQIQGALIQIYKQGHTPRAAFDAYFQPSGPLLIK